MHTFNIQEKPNQRIMLTLLSIFTVFFVLINITSARKWWIGKKPNIQIWIVVNVMSNPVSKIDKFEWKKPNSQNNRFIFQFAWFWSFYGKLYTENTCKTPDDWNGNCVALRECRPLFHLLLGQLTTEQRDFLRKSKCGGNTTNPLVCCPNTFTVDDLPANGTCGTFMSDRIGGQAVYPSYFPWYEPVLTLNTLDFKLNVKI